MTDRNVTEFAALWQAAWNSHDLDRIMAHYDQDIVFRSQKAGARTGHKSVRATETLWWDTDGLVTYAAACHAPNHAPHIASKTD